MTGQLIGSLILWLIVAVIVIGALIVWHVRRRQREKALEHEPAGA